eukprot:gene1309-12465_t
MVLTGIGVVRAVLTKASRIYTLNGGYMSEASKNSSLNPALKQRMSELQLK